MRSPSGALRYVFCGRHNAMENQYKQTGKRIAEIRQVLDIPAAEMAKLTEMSEEEYLKHESGAVEHLGDNLTGAGEGDDEEIRIDLDKVPANVDKIEFTVTIYDADARKQKFGQVENAYIRVVDEETGKELIRYDLGEDFSIETAVVVGEIYRNKGEWKFNAIGSGWSGGLAALGRNYGVNV